MDTEIYSRLNALERRIDVLVADIEHQRERNLGISTAVGAHDSKIDQLSAQLALLTTEVKVLVAKVTLAATLGTVLTTVLMQFVLKKIGG